MKLPSSGAETMLPIGSKAIKTPTDTELSMGVNLSSTKSGSSVATFMYRHMDVNSLIRMATRITYLSELT